MADCEYDNGSVRISGLNSTAWDLRTAVHEFERRHISAVLAGAGGDKVEAARRLGIGLSSLYRKLDELSVSTEAPSYGEYGMGNSEC